TTRRGRSHEDHRGGAKGDQTSSTGGAGMDKGYLILKRGSARRLCGGGREGDYDLLAAGIVVGRIFKGAAAPCVVAWAWALAVGHHEDRTPIYGYEPTREAAMAAFAKSWRRE